ncbi:MAG: lamin tail domain-containing protein, partial [Verrucomicrobiales bacterium]|nr:lamin tail domain-containing protein [Verrucomicrobiales bacterium]
IMSSPNAQVYYTLDGTDPRIEGGGAAPGSIPFEGGPIDEVLISSETSCKYYVPADDSLGLTWTKESFDDAEWAVGANGMGYESPGGPLEDYAVTNLYELMRSPGRSSSVYVRYEFDFENVENLNSLTMRAMIDDGFAAFLNGQKVVSFQAPDELSFDSRATKSRLDSLVVRESSLPSFDLMEFKNLLRKGKNVLAVQAMNTSSGGSDFLFRAYLDVNHTVTSTPLILKESAVVTARAYDGQLWSAPSQETYVIGDTAVNENNLVVSELMYRPPQETDEEDLLGYTRRDDFEFIELLNIGKSPVSLLGSAFTDGVDFDFNNASRSMVGPGERVLLVKDAAAFEHRYGEAAAAKVIGEFEGSTGLSNDGETMTISGADGKPIRTFTYNDKLPWPEAADGDGFSLELISPESNPDHNDAKNWQASVLIGGSPGEGGADAEKDTDEDGWFDATEIFFGSSPTEPGSAPRFQLKSNVLEDGQVQFMFPAELGSQYVIQTSEDLLTWITLEKLILGNGNIVTERFAPSNKRQFYRIKKQ